MTAALGDRTTYIGASDVGAILGLSPYRTPLEVYLEKTGERIPEDLSDNEDVQRGNRLEPLILAEYAELFAAPRLEFGRELTHPDLPFLRVHPDAIGTGFLVEAKAPARRWEAVPEYYRAQCFTQMACAADAVYCDLAPSFGGNPLRPEDVARIERDESVIAYILQELTLFWERVQKKDPPPVSSLEDAKLRWPLSQPSSIEADDEVLALCLDLRNARDQIKRLEKLADEDELAIKQFMGEHAAITRAGKPLFTWTTEANNRLDSKALKAAHPDLYAQFSVHGTKRVFRMKED